MCSHFWTKFLSHRKLRRGSVSSLFSLYGSCPTPVLYLEKKNQGLWLFPWMMWAFSAPWVHISFLILGPRQLRKALKSQNLTFDQCIPPERGRSCCPYRISIIRLGLELGRLYWVGKKQQQSFNSPSHYFRRNQRDLKALDRIRSEIRAFWTSDLIAILYKWPHE